jgi:hypothetical protein
MRRMFRYGELADYAVWFDDDSYLSDSQLFWKSLHEVLLANPDMIGQQWFRQMNSNQWLWIREQPWSSVNLGKPPQFTFFTGGFWALHSRVIEKLDWPIPELRHCGGDCMLGEALRHIGANMVQFDTGVRINANKSGKHSSAIRRGLSEPLFAYGYSGRTLPTDHQKFRTQWICYADGERTCGYM